jgi:hypothetical protein
VRVYSLVPVHVGCAQALDRLLVHQRLASADVTSQFFPRLLEVGGISLYSLAPIPPLRCPASRAVLFRPAAPAPSAIMPMAVPSMPPVRRTVSESFAVGSASLLCGL